MGSQGWCIYFLSAHDCDASSSCFSISPVVNLDLDSEAKWILSSLECYLSEYFLSEPQKWNLNKAPTCSGNGSLAHHPHSSIPVWFSHYVTYISNHVTFSATRERFQHPGTLASLSTLPLKVANRISPPLYNIRKPHLGQCLASAIAPSTWPVLKSPVWLVTPFFG